METTRGVRIDKWLAAVRLYKTRTLAAEACRGGHVEIAGVKVKPAREVRVGDVITARIAGITRATTVLGLTDRRVGAEKAKELAEDLTPASEYAKKRELNLNPVRPRPKGMGRPTKKDRRVLEQFF